MANSSGIVGKKHNSHSNIMLHGPGSSYNHERDTVSVPQQLLHPSSHPRGGAMSRQGRGHLFLLGRSSLDAASPASRSSRLRSTTAPIKSAEPSHIIHPTSSLAEPDSGRSVTPFPCSSLAEPDSGRSVTPFPCLSLAEPDSGRQLML